MRVHVTYAGGTIGMVESVRGLVPGADVRTWLSEVAALAGLENSSIGFSQIEPPIDSSSAGPDQWRSLVENLTAHRDRADGFVVLHGTDTMAYATSALSFALASFGKPVVFTGSQLPARSAGSDAFSNMAGALSAVLSGRAEGVSLFFGRHLFRGNRVIKRSTWDFEGFESPCAAPLACAGAPWEWAGVDAVCSGWPDPLPFRRCDIAVVDIVPGISVARLETVLDPLPEAVLVRAYGVGNAPVGEPGFSEPFERLFASGVPIVICSQCAQASVALGRYEASTAFPRERGGRCPGYDVRGRLRQGGVPAFPGFSGKGVSEVDGALHRRRTGLIGRERLQLRLRRCRLMPTWPHPRDGLRRGFGAILGGVMR